MYIDIPVTDESTKYIQMIKRNTSTTKGILYISLTLIIYKYIIHVYIYINLFITDLIFIFIFKAFAEVSKRMRTKIQSNKEKFGKPKFS